MPEVMNVGMGKDYSVLDYYKIVAKSGECTLTLPRIGRFDDPC